MPLDYSLVVFFSLLIIQQRELNNFCHRYFPLWGPRQNAKKEVIILDIKSFFCHHYLLCSQENRINEF